MTGAELKRARLKSKRTQTDIAKEAKMACATICRLEAGLRDNTIKRMERVLKAYGFVIAPLDGPESPEAWNEYTEQRP